MSGFRLKSVVHLVCPTEARAHNLEELRRGIAAAGPDCLFYHAHQYVLRFHGVEELPPNDFAAWVGGVVQDGETAERLSFAAQAEGENLASLRAALLAVLDRLPEKTRLSRGAPEGGVFRFHGVHSVEVPSGFVPESVDALVECLREVEPSALFYHLFERPLMHPEAAVTLERWVEEQGARLLGQWLREAPQWGLPLEGVRRELLARWKRRQLRRRIAERAREPEQTRQREAQEAMARLVERLRGAGGEESPQ
jgi:hypothetical protein